MRKIKKLKREKNKTKQLFLSFLLLSFIVCLIIFFTRVFKKSIWEGKHSFNFVVQSDKVMIFSSHPKDHLLTILIIPSQIYLPVVRGYGEYQIGNISQLGELENINGGELLSLSLQKFLAAPIDGYIIKNSEQSKIKNQDNSLEKGNLLSLYFPLLKKQAKTNFTWFDLARIFFQIRSLNQSQIKRINLQETGVLEAKKMPDESIIFQPDYFKIDKLSQEIFSDKTILNEELTVTVLNGSQKRGLAENISRLVKNLGAELINSGDAPKEYLKSTIFYRNKDLKQKYTFKRLIKIFPMAETKEDNKIEGDIVFILGNDFKLIY